MSRFDGVANEIIIRIIEETSAGDIVSLASCCKHFSALAQDRLAFHRRKRAIAPEVVIGEYSHDDFDPLAIQTQGGVAGQPRINHPSKYLQRILEDNDCQFYTKTMRIGYLEIIEDADPGVAEDESRVQANRELVTNRETQYGHNVTALVANVYSALLQYLGTYGVKEWTNMIKEGNCAAVIFLLLTLYPNLETLEIYEPERTWANEGDWGNLLRSLISIAKRPKTNKLRPFSRLSKLSLRGHSDGSLEARARLAVPFMELPTMRKIFGDIVDGRDVQWAAGVGISKVIHLDFTGDIDRASLRSLIRGCKGLESFSFGFSPATEWERRSAVERNWGPQAENEAACEDEDSDEPEIWRPRPENRTEADRPRWEPRGIVADLLLYASHSLVSLDLRAGSLAGVKKFSNDEPFIDSLRLFRVLKSVHLDTMMLFKKLKCSSNALEVLRAPKQHAPWENMRPHRLVDFFPVTIEDFVMTSSRVGQGLSREDVAEMFSGLPDARDRLPRLVVIRVERIANWRSEEEKDGWQELRVMCQKNCINLVP
ncbi:hypothetical protein BDR22DRAFT_819900 [Usnea florida]